MATWQLGGLPSMAPQNDNAPRSSVPQPVQYQQQPNVGLMALQGLRGVAEINQQAQISQQLKEYQARLGSAVANNDRVGVQKLMAQYPQFMADSQKQMGFIDAEQNRQTADAAMNLRLASQTGDPLTMQKAIQYYSDLVFLLKRFISLGRMTHRNSTESLTSSTSMLIQIVTLVFKRSSKGRALHSRTQIHPHIMLRLMRNRVIDVSIWSSSKSYPITNYAREKWF